MKNRKETEQTKKGATMETIQQGNHHARQEIQPPMQTVAKKENGTNEGRREKLTTEGKRTGGEEP